MRLKKLLMLIVAMVMAIPTMLAQEDVYFAYNTSTGKFSTPLTQAGQLTYNEATQTYTGQIEIVQSSLTGNKQVLFYKGSTDAPTYIGSGMASMASQLKEGQLSGLATRNQAYGWYITKTEMQNIGGEWESDPQAFDVTVNVANPSAPTVTFALANASPKPTVPTAMYVYTSTESGYTLLGTLEPTEEGGTTFTGEISTLLNNQKFLLCSSASWAAGLAIGQVGDVTGQSQTKDVKLSKPGDKVELNMAKNTTPTEVTNPGTYTLTFDYDAMKLTATLVSLNNNIPQQLRLLQGTGASAFPAPSANDIVLTRQNNGSYVGTFPVSGTSGNNFKFYGTIDSGTVYYGPVSTVGTSLNFRNNDAAVENQALTVGQDVNSVGSWYPFNYPNVGTAQNLITSGMVTATVTLDFEAGTGTVDFKMALDPAPAELLLYTNTKNELTGYSSYKTSVVDNRYFEWTVNAPAGGLYVAISTSDKSNLTNNGWISAVDSKTADATINLADGKYSSTWFAVAKTAWNWAKIVPTAAGEVTIQLDMQTLNVTIFEGAEEEDPNLYMHIARSYTGPWEIAANDPTLTAGEDGYYTVTAENVAKNSGIRFYTKNSYGQPVWIAPEGRVYVNLDESPEYSATYETGDNISAWQIAGLVNDATSATLNISINPESKNISISDPTTPTAPAAMYVWASNETDDEGQPIYKMVGTLNPEEGNANVFAGEINIPSNSMFYLGQSNTTAAFKSYKASYENFQDGGGSSVTGSEPTVKFTDGQYVVELFRGTVAPNGAPTTSIGFAAGGEVKMSFNFSTNMLTVVDPNYVSEGPAYVQIAYQPASRQNISYAPETDAKLMAVEGQEGVYSGNLTMTIGRAFVFYTGEDDGSRTTYNSTYSWPPTMGSGLPIEWGGYNYWPNEASESEDENAANVVVNGTCAWVISFGTTSAEVFTVTLDLNTNKLSIKVADVKPVAPAELYLWGTENGYEGTGWKSMAQFTKAEDADVYTLANFEVPECGPFDSEGVEGGKQDSDTDTGFYFQLCTSATTQSGSAKIFLPSNDERLIDLTKGGEEYTAVVTSDKTGATFICLNPGNYTFTFDFDNMTFTATLNKVEECSLELTFAGSNFELGDNLNDYLTIVDQAVLIGSEGEYNGALNLSSNPFTYTYSTYYPQQVMLQLTPADGYTIENVVAAEVEGAQIEIQSGVTGVWMIQGGENYALPITITLTKDMNKATFNFTGMDDAYTHVNGQMFPSMEDIEFQSNQYIYSYEGSMGGVFLSAAEGYQIEITCTTEGALNDTQVSGSQKADYTINGQSMDGNLLTYAVTVVTPGLEFNVAVSKAPTPVPETGIRFVFTGVEDGYEMFRMMNMLSEDGSDIDITSNPFDVEFTNVFPVMIGFKDDVPEDYTWELTCDNAPQANNVWTLGDPVMEGQHSQRMLVVHPNAYGFTFVIDIQKLTTKTVNITITGDAQQSTASAFTNVTAKVTNFDEEGEGTESDVYFDSPDYSYRFDSRVTFVFTPKDGYFLTLTAEDDVEEGIDTYMWDKDTYTLTVIGDGINFKLDVSLNPNTGITGIYDFDGADSFTVVNLQGVVLLRNAAADELNRLENGMYIINGKKVVVRK